MIFDKYISTLTFYKQKNQSEKLNCPYILQKAMRKCSTVRPFCHGGCTEVQCTPTQRNLWRDIAAMKRIQQVICVWEVATSEITPYIRVSFAHISNGHSFNAHNSNAHNCICHISNCHNSNCHNSNGLPVFREAGTSCNANIFQRSYFQRPHFPTPCQFLKKLELLATATYQE